MPSTAPVVNLAKRIPWTRAWILAQWLYRHGSDRVRKNLDESDRSELWRLFAKSKGKRANLTSREQQRFIDLVKQAARGRPA